VKYSSIFLLQSLFIVGIALYLGGWWYAMLWFAASFFLVGLAYAFNWPKIFGKRADGTLPLWSKLLNAPYLFVYGTTFFLLNRIISYEEPWHRLQEDIYIGRWLSAKESEKLLALEEITNWVDLTSERKDSLQVRSTTNYLSLPTLDASVPTPERLLATLAKLQPGITYIHCAQGHGRTALFTIALLMQREATKSCEEALEKIVTARPGAHISERQLNLVKQIFEPQI